MLLLRGILPHPVHPLLAGQDRARQPQRASTSLLDLDGASLVPLLRGAAPDGDGLAIAEYEGHGTVTPARMVRRGRFKLNYYHGEPPELFDLEDDPAEFTDLASYPDYRSVRDELTAIALYGWNPDDIARCVRESQARRRVIMRGEPPPATQ